MRFTWRISLALLCGLLPAAAMGADAAPDVSVSAVVMGLNNPSGVAVQPETGHVFVSDSAHAVVLRVDVAAKRTESAITGFTQDVYGKGPMFDIGPLGLAFLDQNTLVVGGGGKPDGQEVMQIFTVPAAGQSITVDDATYTGGPIEADPDVSVMGEGNFYGLAVGSGGVYISSNGDDTKGWILRIPLAGTDPGNLEPFIATKPLVNVDAPVGITMNAKGQLVVGQMGEVNVPSDSLLCVYDAASGSLISSATTGLYDIAALAYSPKTGRLYALDFAWMDTAQGALYRLDVSDDGSQVTPVKVVALDKPTAMAFAPDGTLYVTVFGTAEEGAATKPGQLLKIEGDL